MKVVYNRTTRKDNNKNQTTNIIDDQNSMSIIKNHSRTSPDVQFKEFSLTKRKLDLEGTINGLEKPFRKNPIQKIEKKNIKN